MSSLPVILGQNEFPDTSIERDVGSNRHGTADEVPLGICHEGLGGSVITKPDNKYADDAVTGSEADLGGRGEKSAVSLCLFTVSFREKS